MRYRDMNTAVRRHRPLDDAATRTLAVAALLLAALTLAPPAQARFSPKKAIFAPIHAPGGRDAFAHYRALGVGIYQYVMRWDQVAATRPRRAADPNDLHYEWPDELTYAIARANAARMKVAVTVIATPRWAGAGEPHDMPDDPDDYATFVEAASRRFPGVDLWRVWDDTNNAYAIGGTVTPDSRNRPLTNVESSTVARYASLLDATYEAVKSVDRRDLVVGANVTSFGDIGPQQFLRALQIGPGRPARLDLVGFSPYGVRRPVPGLAPALGSGVADLNDLGAFLRWVDRRWPPRRGVPAKRVFLSKFTAPSDHTTPRFGDLLLSREQQAGWLRDALRATQRSRRVYALGWESLADELPDGTGHEFSGGLLDAAGVPKPAYFAFRDG